MTWVVVELCFDGTGIQVETFGPFLEEARAERYRQRRLARNVQEFVSVVDRPRLYVSQVGRAR